MSQEEISGKIEMLRVRWSTVLGWSANTHNRNWFNVYDSGGELPKENFFKGPFAGNEYYTRELVEKYGIPTSMAHQLGQRITLNDSTGQYYIRMDQAEAVKMLFDGLAGFISATDFPVS